MKGAVKILESLKDLLLDPDRWCQGHGAVDELGKKVWSDDPTACKWCLLGGLAKVGNVVGVLTVDRVMAAEAIDNVTGFTPAKFNDTHSHGEVVAVIDRAIEHASKRHVSE